MNWIELNWIDFFILLSPLRKTNGDYSTNQLQPILVGILISWKNSDRCISTFNELIKHCDWIKATPLVLRLACCRGWAKKMPVHSKQRRALPQQCMFIWSHTFHFATNAITNLKNFQCNDMKCKSSENHRQRSEECDITFNIEISGFLTNMLQMYTIGTVVRRASSLEWHYEEKIRN